MHCIKKTQCKITRRRPHRSRYFPAISNNFTESVHASGNIHTLSVLERQAALFKSVTEEDLKEYDDPLTVGEVEAELGKWREYIDIDGVTEEEWCRKYHRYLRFDPIERTPLWEEIYYEVEKETDEAIGRNAPRGMGFCFLYWSSKAAVLARRGIFWKSPHEMNPRVMFD